MILALGDGDNLADIVKVTDKRRAEWHRSRAERLPRLRGRVQLIQTTA